MQLCTFEVATHVGRVSRAGAHKNGRIIDLNFATAWYMAQQGESEPQQLADALVPPAMTAFLKAGLRAMHTAEELFLGAGPDPADWWKRDPPPRGPNDETLVYMPDQVRVCAPLPDRWSRGPDEEAPACANPGCELKIAAVIGKKGANIKASEARRQIAGFTCMNDFGGRCSALGPWLVTPDEIPDPYRLQVVCRINGREFARSSTSNVSGRFEDRIEALSAAAPILPGDVVALHLDLAPPAHPGDVVELEIEKIGSLRNRIV